MHGYRTISVVLNDIGSQNEETDGDDNLAYEGVNVSSFVAFYFSFSDRTPRLISRDMHRGQINRLPAIKPGSNARAGAHTRLLHHSRANLVTSSAHIQWRNQYSREKTKKRKNKRVKKKDDPIEVKIKGVKHILDHLIFSA